VGWSLGIGGGCDVPRYSSTANIVSEPNGLDPTAAVFASAEKWRKRGKLTLNKCRYLSARKVSAQKDGMIMNRITHLWFATVVLGAVLVNSSIAQNPGQNASAQSAGTQATTASEPSLGNYARALKKDKKQEASKKFDNDNLPREDKLSVVGSGTGSADSATTGADQQAASADSSSLNKGKAAIPTVTPGETAEQRQQVYDQWKDKISSQQSEVDLLSRELDVQQREYKLRAAEFYSDAGERLRNEAAWDKEDAEYKQRIAEKQKALDEAKQKLDDVREDARKAGAPSSVRENEEQPQQ
jgi:hypothetical protein